MEDIRTEILTKSPVQIITKEIVIPGKLVNILFPFIGYLKDQGIQKRINDTIYDSQLFVKEHKGQERKPEEIWYKDEESGWYQIKTNEFSILSLLFYYRSFSYPAWRPRTEANSLTFDIRSGKNFKLHELFKPGNEYIKILSDQIKEQIKRRKIDLLIKFESIKPDNDFYIADKCIVVYFQPNEYACTAQGFLYFPIQIYDIEDIIPENSILDRLRYY
ncbi:MAG: DUF3298 domain-containing protein [Firmicutes bacterium]|nr:DUF3298 domain-containing protein [Bacillota bacterium]